MKAEDPARVAVLYQATPPPVIDGIRKDPKPGGYSDSGADIAYCLHAHGVQVMTPRSEPRPAEALDWVFPDTAEGIAAAVDAGATVLWANTVLFTGHPIEPWLAKCWIVGQHPASQQAGDDKFSTNAKLRAAGLPVVQSVLVARHRVAATPGVDDLTDAWLADHGLAFPLVVKPVRGRGSQGVSRVDSRQALHEALTSLFASNAFGDQAMVESFLDGEELTITVLAQDAGAPARALPPVRRFNHADGIAPYNGAVAVTRNSEALSPERMREPAVQALLAACIAAFDAVHAKAPIRIDCRADQRGQYLMFDLNMKPNMTGAGRPGREAEDSLSLIAARAIDWQFEDLLVSMLAGAWRL